MSVRCVGGISVSVRCVGDIIDHSSLQCVVHISDADFNPSTTITVAPPGSKTCIDFTDLVIDDAIALEGDQNFTIIVGESVAWVTIIDDDGKFLTIISIIILAIKS